MHVPFRTLQSYIPFRTLQSYVPFMTLQSHVPWRILHSRVPLRTLQTHVPFKTLQLYVLFWTLQSHVPFRTLQWYVLFKTLQSAKAFVGCLLCSWQFMCSVGCHCILNRSAMTNPFNNQQKTICLQNGLPMDWTCCLSLWESLSRDGFSFKPCYCHYRSAFI